VGIRPSLPRVRNVPKDKSKQAVYNAPVVITAETIAIVLILCCSEKKLTNQNPVETRLRFEIREANRT